MDDSQTLSQNHESKICITEALTRFSQEIMSDGSLRLVASVYVNSTSILHVTTWDRLEYNSESLTVEIRLRLRLRPSYAALRLRNYYCYYYPEW